MTTALELIEETKRHLYSGLNDEMNRLNGSLTSNATTMTLTYPLGGIQPGATISVDLEEMHVWAVEGTQATIERGVNGSIPAVHDDLDTVYVRPKFSNFRVLKAINNDLLDLSSPWNGLYQIKVVTATFNPATQGYDMTSATDILGIAEITYDEVGPGKTFPKIDTYTLRRGMATTDFASGYALVLYDAGFPGRAVRVKYRAPFGQLATVADDVLAVTGLPTSAHDLPPLGAALRLVAPRDIKRSFSESQGEPRRSDEVPVGASGQAMRGIAALRSMRITAEASRLEAAYPKQLVV